VNRIEEIAENLFALTTLVPIAGRSWLPPGTTGLEPFNRYLTLSNSHALLIDTGPAAHRAMILESLDRMVGARKLTVMVTRSELDCISNVGAIVDRFRDLRVIGVMKNLPLLGLVHMERPPRHGLSAERMPMGRTLADYGFERFKPMPPVIKTLSTIWMMDELSGTLFTSDSFSADLMHSPDDPLVRRDAGGFPPPATLRRHILAKFDWLARADTGSLHANWEQFFADVRPLALAPGLGRIQMGRGLVEGIIRDYRTAIFGDEPRLVEDAAVSDVRKPGLRRPGYELLRTEQE
jgi:hypothetical protein